MGGTGNFFVGRGSSVGATVNISGTAIVNVGNRYLMGGSDTPNAPAVPTAIATGSVTHHSAGTLNTDLDIRIADTFITSTSEATYNLSGTGIINTNVSAGTTGSSIIGRQGNGRFFQTGGTANFNSPLVVGNREAATTTTANGLYEISAGDLNVIAPTPTWPLALNIAPDGTGQFRVVGDDATIDVIGDFAISSTANGNGTLAYRFESGDLLSQINVTGNVTFNAGAILDLDTSIAPSQTSYDLLTAVDIIDSGLVFNELGWSYSIVAGGNGEILRVTQAAGLPGDFNSDSKVDAADYVTWRANETANAALPNDNNVGNQTARYTLWRANFGNPGAGGGLSASSVPEPTVALLALLGAISLALRRCRCAFTFNL
jgi:hypothetical protein